MICSIIGLIWLPPQSVCRSWEFRQTQLLQLLVMLHPVLLYCIAQACLKCLRAFKANPFKNVAGTIINPSQGYVEAIQEFASVNCNEVFTVNSMDI